jgi:L-alanine-DL-glutamate epimerase-like enolase superfamily enzyme
LSTFAKVAELPVEVSSYALEPHELEVSSEFTRLTTVVRLQGGGEEGIGEDVTYDALDHVALQEAGPGLPLAGSYSLAEFCDKIGELNLFPAEPVRDVSRLYRRWAFESAALDLALRQAGHSLADALGRDTRAVTFVMSMRIGRPPAIEPVRRRLERYPTLRFKLDPTSDWSDELIAELVATGAIDSVDFKGFYKGTIVDQPADPELYRRVIEGFPDAWYEDPALTEDTRPLFAGKEDQVTWDAPIHSIADIEDLPFPPRMVNVKPSRFGSLRSLFDCYDYLAEREIDAYGGGQWELACGRGQIQYLASLFHADAPNDVAPIGYGYTTVPDGLPASPLRPSPSPTGFRWDAS